MHVDVFVADHFDTLQSGKTIAIGLYTDRVIIINVPSDAPDPSEKPYGIDLSVLVCLTELPAGNHSLEIVIEDETGVVVGPAKGSQISITVEEGKSSNCIIGFRPFLVPYEGAYYVAAGVGEQRERVPLWIRINRA
jgi:hypothetical protein